MTNLIRLSVSNGLFECIKNLMRSGKYESHPHIVELLVAGKLRVDYRAINGYQHIYVRPKLADALYKFAASTGRAKIRALDMLAQGKVKPLQITPHVAIKANRAIVTTISKLAATRNITVEQCTADMLNRGEVIEVRGASMCPGYAYLFLTQDAYEKLRAEADAADKTVSSVLYKRVTRLRPNSCVRLYNYLKPAVRRRADREHTTMSGMLRDILMGKAEPIREALTSCSHRGSLPCVVPPEMYASLVRYANRCKLSLQRLIELIVTGKAPHLGAASAAAGGLTVNTEVKAELVDKAPDTQNCAPVARCISASELQSLVDVAVKKALQAAVKELLAKLA